MPTDPRRPLAVLAAALALASGCTATVAGAGRADPAAPVTIAAPPPGQVVRFSPVPGG